MKASWLREQSRLLPLLACLGVIALPYVAQAITVEPAVGFTAAQATEGRNQYAAHCASCHGADLQGRGAPSLIGARFAIAWLNGQKTAADLDRRVRGTMPMDAPHSLTNDQYSAVIAYLLQRNGYGSGAAPYTPSTMAGAILKPQTPTATSKGDAPRPALPMPPQTVDIATTARPDDAEVARPDNASWLMYNKELGGGRYSTLDQINAGNAGRLVPRCMVQIGEISSFQSSPVVYERILYVTTPYSTYAFDATDCRKVWSHSYPEDLTPPSQVSRGVAIYKGKLFRITPNGHLLALDAKTGKLLWDVWMADQSKGYWLSAAPIAYDGKVFIGEAGADFGANGHAYAFDAETGRRIWTFNVIPTGKEKGAETWKNGAEHGGGSMWSTMALDPARHELYISVGNPAPDFDATVRRGDNLFTNSVVVLDERTGALRWYAQQIPHDTRDHDTAAAPIVFQHDGRRYMAVANKGGHLFIYDADTHKLLSKTAVAKQENVDAPVTTQGTHACPGTSGGVEWNGPAFSPATGLLYVNSVDWCATDTLVENRYIEGTLYMSGEYTFDPIEEARGNTYAVAAATGKTAWVRPQHTPMLAGVTPTAGGVVFTGDLDGQFQVLDARSGNLLYSFSAGGPIAAGPSTYMIGGRQYVAVASGNTSRLIWKVKGAATITLFALGDR